jgi:hypothetical protein
MTTLNKERGIFSGEPVCVGEWEKDRDNGGENKQISHMRV